MKYKKCNILTYMSWVGNPLLNDDVFERGILWKANSDRYRYLIIYQGKGSRGPTLFCSTHTQTDHDLREIRWSWMDEKCNINLLELRIAIRRWARRNGVEIIEERDSEGVRVISWNT